MKTSGLQLFFLLFYNQVVGLPPQMVAAAMAIALVCDGFFDPLVGQISDNFRSPWGRRHPFMYASALPMALAFFAIFNPPAGWQGVQMFAYMLIVGVISMFISDAATIAMTIPIGMSIVHHTWAVTGATPGGKTSFAAFVTSRGPVNKTQPSP